MEDYNEIRQRHGFEESPESKEESNNPLTLLLPSKDYFVTPVLNWINVLVFIAMIASEVDPMLPASEDLLQWGANFRPWVLEGQYWRVLSSAFVHIGILHLAMNMYALVYIGKLLEPLLGRTRFLTAYLMTAITGGLLSLYWHEASVSAGASGAIFGMYGVFIALLTTNLIERKTRNSLLSSIGVFVVFNLLYGLQGNVDNAGHLGSLLGGIAIGYSMFPSLKKENSASLLPLPTLALGLFFGLGGFWMISGLSNDYGVYEKMLQRLLALNEDLQKTNTINPEKSSPTYTIEVIEKDAIAAIHEGQRILDSIKVLDLPEQTESFNEQYAQYFHFLKLNLRERVNFLNTYSEEAKNRAFLYGEKADSVVLLMNSNGR